jgi:TPR repeat protein
MITLFLSLAFTVAAGQQQTSLPSDPTPAQETVKRQPLSSSEISQLRTKAEAGDASAQSALGKAYWTGDGVPHSDETAATWFRKAADQRDADAENALGTMYRTGEGVTKDRDEALGWYHNAARDGSAAAMFNLGAAYYNGNGVNIDDVTSCAWFLLAQEAGYPQADDAVSRATSERAARPIQAAEKIGEMYFKGGELPKNPDKALKWYRKAADGGVHEAAVNAAALLIGGPNPTADEYAEAHKRCEDAAKLDYGPAAYCMAVIYRRGLGVTQDATESAKWLIRAANLGHPKAMLQLGEAYWKGDGVKPNLITAYTWIWMAYKFQATGAQQDEEALRKQMDARDVEIAKKNAETPVRRPLLVPQKRRTDGPSQ